MLKRAYRVGGAAVRLLLNNDSDRMVTLVRETGPQYRCTTDSVEIARVADQQRPLPREFLDANRMMITGAFYDYAIPQLGDPLPPTHNWR